MDCLRCHTPLKPGESVVCALCDKWEKMVGASARGRILIKEEGYSGQYKGKRMFPQWLFLGTMHCEGSDGWVRDDS